MAKCYKHPPIEEAVVEFRFVPGPGQEWDMTIPGKLHEHQNIKKQYSGKPRTQLAREAIVQSLPGRSPNLTVQEGVDRIQLVSEDGIRLISLAPDILSVNTLKPYDGWSAFRERIDIALRAYYEITQSIGVSRIGVRYINKIVLPGSSIDWVTYFRYGKLFVPDLESQVASFFSKVKYTYADDVTLLFTQATVDASGGHSAIALDLDFICENTEGKEINEIMSIVDDLHKREGIAFEAILTDATREIFNGD